MFESSSPEDSEERLDPSMASPSGNVPNANQTLLRTLTPVHFPPNSVSLKKYGTPVGRTTGVDRSGMRVTQYIMHPSGRKVTAPPGPVLQSRPTRITIPAATLASLASQASGGAKSATGFTVVRPVNNANIRFITAPSCPNRSLLAPKSPAVVRQYPSTGNQFIKLTPANGQPLKIYGREESRKNLVVVKRSAGAVSTKLAVSTTDSYGRQRVQIVEGWKNPRSLIATPYLPEGSKKVVYEPSSKEPEPDVASLSEKPPVSPPTFTGVEDYLFGTSKKIAKKVETVPPPSAKEEGQKKEVKKVEEKSKEVHAEKVAEVLVVSKEEIVEEEAEKTPVEISDSEKEVIHCLEWEGSVGSLRGSAIRFKINEFGVLEMLEGGPGAEKRTASPLPPLDMPPKKQKTGRKSDELLKCEFCGTYGMVSEFIEGRFCGRSCLEDKEKAKSEEKRQLLERERRVLLLKAKRAQLLQQKAMLSGMGASQAQEVLDIQLQRTRMERELLKLEDVSLIGTIDEGTELSRQKYMHKVVAKAAGLHLFKDAVPPAKCMFKVGMKVEAIDPVRPSLFCVCTIVEIQGYRMKLHFDGYKHCHDFWVNANSTEIFHPGWCERTDHKLTPPRGYEGPFNWTLYLESQKSVAAPRHAFLHPQEKTITPSGFRIGMKLEAVDKRNSKLVCVATIADVIDNKILIHFDGWEDLYDFWAENNSPYIHPAGWCEENGYTLHAPPDYPRIFRWDEYTTEERGFIAPARAFKHRAPYEFKKGMKVEAVDKRNPSLIRIATVIDTEFHQIKIKFDGWPEVYAYWVDDDCPDIHPIGWCALTSHPLTAPPSYEELDPPADGCSTPGCTGVGHAYNTAAVHVSVATCPYSALNYLNDELIPDRFHSVAEYHSAKNSSYSKGTKPRSLLSRKVRLLDHKKPSQKIARQKVEPAASPPPPVNSKKDSERSNFLAKFKKEVAQIVAGFHANPRLWSHAEVEKFIGEFMNEEKAKTFSENDIDGEALLLLCQNDLTDYLNFKLGPAIKLYNCIRVLRQQSIQLNSV